MKNVKPEMLKKSIFMLYDEFAKMMGDLGIKVDYEYDGISYYKSSEDEFVYYDELNEILSDYFDVNVTSVHSDDFEMLGVWITYKEN